MSYPTESNRLQDLVLAVLRITTAFVFIQHATSKFFEFPMSMTNGAGSIELFSLMGLAGVLELVGGILLILGCLVRPVAFILSGQMAVAYLFFHVAQWSGWATLLTPLRNNGESAVLFCFIFLFLSVAGGGAYAMDNLRNPIPEKQ
ncbi:DoxX family protein [Pelistega europaea]|uniref:DoxX family protein n=1 Tax=Pelistega europaea TaxID=106147 RepID=A0A7Y4L8U8_9BURK|nr:DoxX family protein [Pelistega europaea]NOL49044.1 DoxX family protein [Pelistega europaea]